jgi:DNA adenine methylase
VHYIEPYGGGLSTLLARDPNDSRFWVQDDSSHRGVSELVNDLDSRLVNFWRVLQDPTLFALFARQVQAVPVSRPHWEAAHAHPYGQDPVADAVAFFTDCRQSLAGRMDGFTGITRARTRGARNAEANAWWGAVEGLAAVHARLAGVVIECGPAVEVICREDGKPDARTENNFYYCDPPYLAGSRESHDVYAYEMSDDDHAELLTALKAVKGKVLLSCYDNPQYNAMLAGWRRREVKIANHAAGGKEKRTMTEVVWCNYDPERRS